MFGCSGESEDGAPGLDALVGFIETAPDLGGAWHLTTMVLTDACGMGLIPTTDEWIFQVSQADTEISFAVFDECGTPVSQGSGMVTHSGVATFSFEETVDLAEECSLVHTLELTGTSDSLGEMINGSFSLTVSPIDDDCDITSPCDVTGTFLAQSCPPP
jgi:hypothetical protein